MEKEQISLFQLADGRVPSPSVSLGLCVHVCPWIRDVGVSGFRGLDGLISGWIDGGLGGWRGRGRGTHPHRRQ